MKYVVFAILMASTGGCATTRPAVAPATAPATRPASSSPCDTPPDAKRKDPASEFIDIDTCPVTPEGKAKHG